MAADAAQDVTITVLDFMRAGLPSTEPVAPAVQWSSASRAQAQVQAHAPEDEDPPPRDGCCDTMCTPQALNTAGGGLFWGFVGGFAGGLLGGGPGAGMGAAAGAMVGACLGRCRSA